MTQFSRRAILKNGLLAVGSGMAAPSIFGAFANAPARAATLPGTLSTPRIADNGKILVVVQLAGGHDGLHAVIPFADPLYTQLRPTLAVASADQLPLNAQLALHSKLSALKPLWDAGQMGIIENVGYPNPNLSHFQSMYIWQTLDLTGAQGAAKTGWLGKYMQAIGSSTAHPFTGVESGNLLAAAFMATGVAVPTINNPDNFAIKADGNALSRADERQQTLLKLYTSYGQTSSANAQLLQDTSQAAQNGSVQLHQAFQAYKPAVVYPTTGLGDSLKLIATAITQGLAMRVGYVTLGGFDTHADQANTLDKLYTEFGAALAAFWQDLTQHNAADNVIMMTWSEFGRRVKQNGSDGTDHGTAAPMFVFGPGIKGGIHGDTPDLSTLDQTGNLPFKTDFRAVYGTILSQWLGADASTVLGGTFDTLDFIK